MKKQIMADLKTAMLNKRPVETGVLRALLTAFSNFEKSASGEVMEADYVQIVRKQIKQREESARIYKENGRQDLCGLELAEIAVLEDYMPKAMTEEEVSILVDAVVERTRLELVKSNMGNIVKLVVADASGRTDGKMVSSIVSKLIAAQVA